LDEEGGDKKTKCMRCNTHLSKSTNQASSITQVARVLIVQESVSERRGGQKPQMKEELVGIGGVVRSDRRRQQHPNHPRTTGQIASRVSQDKRNT